MDLQIDPDFTSKLSLWEKGEAAPLPEPATAPSLFAAQVARCPDLVAVEDVQEALTYRQLDARAERLANALAAQGAAGGDRIGVLLPRRASLMAALIAIHRVGAAFVPLDLTLPPERIAVILRDSGARCVIAEASAELPAGVSRVDPAASAPPRQAGPGPGPDDLAYILYTSGSTGAPKGVAVAQDSLVNLALWGAQMLGPSACRGMLFSTAIVFDVAMFEIYSPLLSGGRLLVVENLLGAIPEALRAQARVVSSAPTVLGAALRASGLPESVEAVVTAGEALSRDLADRILAARPGARLINAYGPTEATVYASVAEIAPSESSTPTIGRPLPNMELYVLDGDLRRVGAGEEGELCIGGIGVAQGYWNRPDLTVERFVSNPFGAGRLYRTGDRARWRADGQLDYLGRADGQLKLHGVRIEPGEVEAALARLPNVAVAAVDIRGEGENKRLVAWVVADGASPGALALRRGLSRLLPRPMVPSAYVSVPELPTTISGKLNRAALPAPGDADRGEGAPYRPPSTPLAQEIHAIWRAALETQGARPTEFGVDDEFIDIGGDSLGMVRMLIEFEMRFGVVIPGDRVPDPLTIAALAELKQSLTPAAPRLVQGFDMRSAVKFVSVRPARGASRGAVLEMPGYAGGLGTISAIAAEAFADYDFWGISLALGGRDLREGALALEAAEAMAERLRAEAGLSPKAFVGFSMGGMLGWLIDRIRVRDGLAATPLINLDGLAVHLHRPRLAQAISSALPPDMADSRPKMLLFQSCITDGVNDDGDCAREWRSQGVAVDCVRLRTGAHLDFRRRELFHAVAGMLDAFVEAREAPAGLVERLECLEFDTDGGLAFRLVADEKAPDAEAVRGLIARKNFRDDDDLQKHVLGAIKRAGDPALSLDYAQTSVALWPHDPQSHARLGETLAKVGDAANARKAFLAAVDLAPEVESYRKALADVSE